MMKAACINVDINYSTVMDASNAALIGLTCNCLALKSAARNLARRYDEALAKVDLSNGQFSILTAVAALGVANTQRVGEVLSMDRTTVTAALKPLERRALIELIPVETDLRQRAIRISPEGRQLLKRAIPLWQQAQLETEALLGGSHRAEELRELAGLLN